MTCEQRRFMTRRIAYVYDRTARIQMGDRVRVDNREGIREGVVRGMDLLILDGRKKRRLQVYLDPII